jgi:hypothetical protein
MALRYGQGCKKSQACLVSVPFNTGINGAALDRSSAPGSEDDTPMDTNLCPVTYRSFFMCNLLIYNLLFPEGWIGIYPFIVGQFQEPKKFLSKWVA